VSTPVFEASRRGVFVARLTTPLHAWQDTLRTVAEQLLTVNEGAAQLRIKPETVRRWLRAGKIRGALPGGDKMGYHTPRAK